MSVRTPPPKFIISDFLSAFCEFNSFHILMHVSIFLFSSPDLITIFLKFFISDLLIKISRQYLSVFSSTSIKTLLKSLDLILFLAMNIDRLSLIYFD